MTPDNHRPAPPMASDAVASWFDDVFRIYGDVLDSQRRFAVALVQAAAPVLDMGGRAPSRAAEGAERLSASVQARRSAAGDRATSTSPEAAPARESDDRRDRARGLGDALDDAEDQALVVVDVGPAADVDGPAELAVPDEATEGVDVAARAGVGDEEIGDVVEVGDEVEPSGGTPDEVEARSIGDLDVDPGAPTDAGTRDDAQDRDPGTGTGTTVAPGPGRREARGEPRADEGGTDRAARRRATGPRRASGTSGTSGTSATPGASRSTRRTTSGGRAPDARRGSSGSSGSSDSGAPSSTSRRTSR